MQGHILAQGEWMEHDLPGTDEVRWTLMIFDS